MTTKEFNDEPVFYCNKCMSLRILSDEVVGDYCMDCGSTDVQCSHIDTYLLWKKKRNL